MEMRGKERLTREKRCGKIKEGFSRPLSSCVKDAFLQSETTFSAKSRKMSLNSLSCLSPPAIVIIPRKIGFTCPFTSGTTTTKKKKEEEKKKKTKKRKKKKKKRKNEISDSSGPQKRKRRKGRSLHFGRVFSFPGAKNWLYISWETSLKDSPRS